MVVATKQLGEEVRSEELGVGIARTPAHQRFIHPPRSSTTSLFQSVNPFVSLSLRGENSYSSSRCYMPDADCRRNLDGGSWTAEDWTTLPLDFTSNMMAGGKKQYYLGMESALYLLGGGNNGRYYDAATGRFLSEDPAAKDGQNSESAASENSNSQLLTPDSSPDENLYRYAGNDPVNNLDSSGHKDEKLPQTQGAQQHNPTSSTSTLTGSGALAGKTQLKPSPSQLPNGRRVIRPNDRPRTPESEPAEKPGEPAPSEPVETPTPSDATTTTAGEAGGEVATGAEVGEVGGTAEVTEDVGGPLAWLVTAAAGVGAGVGYVVQKVAVGPIQKLIHAHQEHEANRKGREWTKHFKEKHPAVQPKDKPAPTTPPGRVPSKPPAIAKDPGGKGGGPIMKTDGTEAKEPAPPTKEEQPTKNEQEAEKSSEPTKREQHPKEDSGQKTSHSQTRANEAKQGNTARDVGAAHGTSREGKTYVDTKTGNVVHVRCNKAVVTDPKTGKQITQFKNSRSNTLRRI